MDGARHQFLAGPAFAENQHRDVARSHARDELIDVAHARAVAHHVVLQADFVLQAAIFLLERLHAARVVERGRGDAADRGQQLQMIFIEARLRIAGVQINDAHDAVEDFQRHRQYAADAPVDHAGGVGKGLGRRKIVASSATPSGSTLRDDGPADLHGLDSVPCGDPIRKRSSTPRAMIAQ